jgi:hypothetical protein
VIEAQRRHLGNTEFAAGEQPPVPRNHIVIAIDQDRDIESEGPDAVGDLPDLPLAVAPWVGGVWFQLLDRAIGDRNPTRDAGAAE